ncbi:MAG: hypothetical protein AAF721_41740 [Myxococcota bacterium]
MLIVGALALAAFGVIEVQPAAAQPEVAAPEAASAIPAEKPVRRAKAKPYVNSMQTCGDNFPACGNDDLCPDGYPDCIDANGGCYCHGTGDGADEDAEPIEH